VVIFYLLLIELSQYHNYITYMSYRMNLNQIVFFFFILSVLVSFYFSLLHFFYSFELVNFIKHNLVSNFFKKDRFSST
jgi:uncharacterized membrane protein required for colicin V production